ncbi:hypothetical protein [Streptomyces sp. NBC_01294]|uniref:hypothetical protein n=1 Tax=Streptomyces sp. NBC_01294 TaxID=2903815 RepID=UPI002DDBBDC1|nr:hypothetical protein [Streptomyces sp. NBC_01294]WRZ62159.1 hypothetical protein OG534_01145 [Streptomyces sp. NBC_01294]
MKVGAAAWRRTRAREPSVSPHIAAQVRLVAEQHAEEAQVAQGRPGAFPAQRAQCGPAAAGFSAWASANSAGLRDRPPRLRR